MTTVRALRARERTLDLTGIAHVMGILNLTPDSFSDGGRYRGIDAVRARAGELVAQGASIIDLGGRSYASGRPRVAADEERARVVPALTALLRDGLDVMLSIDTVDAGVAEAALAAGAHLINDCSGLADPALAAVVARYDAALVVMHLKGELGVRAPAYRYDDALPEILGYLTERLTSARAAGVRADALVVDPGLEFGKEPATDIEIVNRFGELRALGQPMLLAASRKRFMGRLVGAPASDLLPASLAVATLGIRAGAAIVRAHDVAETVQVARLLAALGPVSVA